MLAQTNARVLEILGASDTEDYDHDPGAGVSLWSGDADGYLSSTARVVTDGENLNRLSTDTLVIDEEVTPALIGQSVRYEYGGVQTVREIVQVGVRPQLPAIPAVVKLYLKDA